MAGARGRDFRQYAGRNNVVCHRPTSSETPGGRAVVWLTRYGPAALLLSWTPFIGDALCLASGWLRQNVAVAVLFIAIGKFARYWVLAKGVSYFGA